MKRRILSLLLSLLLATSVCMPSALAADAASVTLSYDYGGISIFAGAVVTLKTTTVGDFESVRLMFSEDGDFYESVASSDGMSPSFEVTLAEGPNYFKAQLIDADDSVLASSEPLMIEGYAENKVRDVWNVDFNSGVNVAQSSSTSTTIKFKDGSDNEIANSDGSVLRGDIGTVDAGNSVTLLDAPVDSAGHGKAIKIVTASGSANNKHSQLNSFATAITGTSDNVAIFQMDYLFEANRKTTVMAINNGNSADPKWFPSLTLESSVLKFNSTSLFKPELNKWYTVTQIIDFGNLKITCLIDNKIVGSASFSDTFVKTTRLRCGHENATTDVNAVIWADNFIAKEVKFKKVVKTKVFEISSDDYSTPVYSGSKVVLNSNVQNYNNASEVEWHISPDGADYTPDTVSEPNEAVHVTLPYETTYVKAVLTDSSGGELAESNVLTFSTIGLSVLETVWDVDFDKGETLSTPSNSQMYVCDSKGDRLTNAYSAAFAAHSGSDDSTIEIVSNPIDTDHGKSLRLYAANSSDEVQINSLGLSFSAPVVLTEWDCCLTETASKFIPMIIRCNKDASATYDPAYITQTSSTMIFEGASKNITSSKNRWYNIKLYTDTAAKTFSWYVDDVYICTVSTSNAIHSLNKLRCSIKGENAECWVDNVKVMRMCKKPEVTSVESVDDNTVKLAFAEAVPADLFSKDLASSITLTSGQNTLAVTDAAVSSDGTYMTLGTSRDFYTAVSIALSIELADESVFEHSFTLPAKPFDITNVGFTSSGSYVGAEATIVNTTGTPQSVIMFFVVEKDGAITHVSPAYNENITGTATLTVSPVNLGGGRAKVFFLDNWNSLTAVKSYVYTQ